MRVAVVADPHFRGYVLDVFARHPDVQLVCFAEERPEADTVCGIPIVSFLSLQYSQYDAVLLVSPYIFTPTLQMDALQNLGVENLWIVTMYAVDTKADFLADGAFHSAMVNPIAFPGKGKPYVVHIETHVCDHCNLNCKACSHFSPFVREHITANPEQFEKDVKRLSELVDVGRFVLLGGEPLLEPELCMEMVKISRRFLPRTELRIATNGTLLLQMKSAFWDCLRENNVMITLTLYPPVVDKLPQIEKKLDESGILRVISPPVTSFYKRLTLYPFEDPERNNTHCYAAFCHYLQNGQVSKCPDALLVGHMAEALGTVPEAVQDRGAVRLEEVSDGWDLVRRLRAPCGMCRRCASERLAFIPWESAGTHPNPVDWLVEDRLSLENRLLLQYSTQLEQEFERLKGQLPAQ